VQAEQTSGSKMRLGNGTSAATGTAAATLVAACVSAMTLMAGLWWEGPADGGKKAQKKDREGRFSATGTKKKPATHEARAQPDPYATALPHTRHLSE
jgi:hypothetical protein